MNILLATYSYYPYTFGGTEIYVSGLAQFLHQHGHNVTVVAGMPPKAFIDHPVFYEDEEIQTVTYELKGIAIVGAINRSTATEELYSKSKKVRIGSWLNVLSKKTQNKHDIVHFHAFNSAIGFDLLQAVKQQSPDVKIIASYHLPISCTKNTLLYGNTLSDCTITPTKNDCTACVINTAQKMPLTLTKFVIRFMPLIPFRSVPTIFKLKYLVGLSINAFNEFNNSIHQWQVFSNQIRAVLLLNKVLPQKIILLRHGINDLFFRHQEQEIINQRLNSSVTTFLYIGRFEKEKGILTLLKSWCGMKESASRRLEMIGERMVADENLIKWIAVASKRKDIIWHGQQSQQQTAAIMQRVHCTIIPSEWVEIGPLVFHEAISSGSDVIASDIGGCKELSGVYQKKSTLFRAGDMHSLQQAIINYKYSNASYKAISQNENYTNVLSQYISLVPANQQPPA